MFCPHHSPLTELYAPMIAATPSSTTRLKWGRYTSCSVASSTVTSTMKRAFSMEFERVVLGARHDPALGAPGEGGPDLAEVVRIVAVGLLGPTPGRVAGQVDADPAEEVAAQGADLPADHVADLLLELDVPGGAAGHGDRERGAVAGHAATGSVDEPRAGKPEPLDLRRARWASCCTPRSGTGPAPPSTPCRRRAARGARRR